MDAVCPRRGWDGNNLSTVEEFRELGWIYLR